MFALFALSAAGIVALGCNGAQSARLVDYLDELEFDVPLETAAYVSLGRFDIPITASHKPATGSKFVQEIGDQGPVWMRLQFELTAETSPQHEIAVAAAVERHRGVLNDAVLTIVRSSTVDELADPRLAAVNARISEVARPILGEGRVRQLVFNDPQSVAERQKKEEAKKGHGGHGGHGGDSEHGEDETAGEHGAHGEEGHGGGHAEEGHGTPEAHGDDHGHH
jgi:hypothetical protein